MSNETRTYKIKVKGENMAKKLTLRDLKNKLNKMDDKELDNELVVVRDDLQISGVVTSIKKRKESLYTDNDEDFFTRKQLVDDHGVFPCDIKENYIEYFKKGELYLEF